MPKNVKFTTPQLPAAPREYEQGRFEKILNSLRLYFSQLDNHLRSKEFELESNSMEITSLDTGDKEKPIISLFRNSSSPANSDKLGAIRWFGQADSGEKKLFGQIYTKAADIGDASEQGEMVFTIAADNGLAGSVANAVTDITADLANDLDPAFTITQNEVKIPGTNNFMIEDAGNGGAVQFKESGGNVGAVNFVDITGNRAVQFPDASGTVITTGNLSGITSVGTLAQDTLEITSTDAGAGEKPNVSLYRNSSSPAASDEMGSIDFYGNDSAGNKTLYGQIYTEASVVTNGSEQAHLNFAVASGSSGFEDPVVRMRKYALEVLPNNTLDLHQNSFIKFEGSVNDGNETSLTVDNPTADRTITLPDATGTVVLNESGTISTTNLTATGTISVFNSTSEAALLKVGRDDNQDITMFGDDNTLTIKAAQDADGNTAHSFILDRVFGGTGLSDFRIRHDGNDEFVISDNSGAVTATFNATTLQLTDTTTGSATEGPVIELYRNGGNGDDADELGAIKFFSNDDAGNKHEFASIYTEIFDASNTTEDGIIKFSVGANAGTEDPVISIKSAGLVMTSGNDIFFGNPADNVEWDTGSYKQFLRGRSAESSGANSTIELPDKDGTVVVNNSGVISETATKLEITDTTTGSTTENPSIELYRNGGAGADGHELGAIKFFGNNDAGTPEKIEYAKIYAELIDASDGTEDGSLKFHLLSNGSSEDPVMTLQQFGLIMASGNSIYLGANGTLSFEGTDETNNLETAIVATNPTADRTITLPDSTGTVALTGATNTAEFFEIASATTSSADNACHPVLSIYDNADRSSQADHPSGGLNNAGA